MIKKLSLFLAIFALIFTFGCPSIDPPVVDDPIGDDPTVTPDEPEPIKVSGVSISSLPEDATDKTIKTTLTASKEISLQATITPANADDKSVKWSSNNESVAKVDENGKVTLLGGGSATITVTTVDGNFTDSITITVTIPVENVTLDKTGEIKTHLTAEQITLKATITPDNATNKEVTWSTSDEKVATIDTEGKVTIVAGGEVTLTVKTVDGEKTAEVKVSIKELAEKPAIGDAITKDAKIIKKDQISSSNDKDNAIGIVYKVDDSGKAYVIGNKISDPLAWCSASSQANKNQTPLTSLQSITTGEGSFELLAQCVSDANVKGNYPAFDFVKYDYCDGFFCSGWFLPTKEDLACVAPTCTEKVNDQLTAIGGTFKNDTNFWEPEVKTNSLDVNRVFLVTVLPQENQANGATTQCVAIGFRAFTFVTENSKASAE